MSRFLGFNYKAAQKDTNARWTLKVGGEVRHRPDVTSLLLTHDRVAGFWLQVAHQH